MATEDSVEMYFAVTKTILNIEKSETRRFPVIQTSLFQYANVYDA